VAPIPLASGFLRENGIIFSRHRPRGKSGFVTFLTLISRVQPANQGNRQEQHRWATIHQSVGNKRSPKLKKKIPL
jgi:hypothetical protein